MLKVNQLVGFGSGAGGGSNFDGVWAVHSTTTSAKTATHTMPSTLQAGDVGIFFTGTYAVPTLTNPSAARPWDLAHDGTGQGNFSYRGLWTRLLTAADASSVLTETQGASHTSYGMSALCIMRPSIPAASATPFGGQGDTNTGTVTSETVTNGSAGHRLYVACGHSLIDPVIFCTYETLAAAVASFSLDAGNPMVSMKVSVIPEGDQDGAITATLTGAVSYGGVSTCGIEVTF